MLMILRHARGGGRLSDRVSFGGSIKQSSAGTAAMKALGGQYQGAATQILAAEANYVVSNHQVEEH